MARRCVAAPGTCQGYTDESWLGVSLPRHSMNSVRTAEIKEVRVATHRVGGSERRFGPEDGPKQDRPTSTGGKLVADRNLAKSFCGHDQCCSRRSGLHGREKTSE